MNRSYSELVPLRTSSRNPPLFCVHDGIFQQMAAALQVDQSLYGLRPINLHTTSVSVEQLAASHVENIRMLQPRGPYRIIGYSFGGMVAYEMATLLANKGEVVALLALVDTLNPSFRSDLSPAELVKFRKTYLADRIRKYIGNLRRGRIESIGADATRFIANKVKPVAWKITKRVYQALDRPLPNRSDAVIFKEMIESYTPKEYRGHLVLFRVKNAMGGGTEYDDDISLGWSKYVKDGVDIQFVEGGHETVMHMPYVLSLASKLEPYLADIGRAS
jgi:thioesterase domain-containing protein